MFQMHIDPKGLDAAAKTARTQTMTKAFMRLYGADENEEKKDLVASLMQELPQEDRKDVMGRFCLKCGAYWYGKAPEKRCQCRRDS